MPYLYFGEILVEDKRVYIFNDFNWDEYEEILSSNNSYSNDTSIAVGFLGGPFPDWVELVPLKEEYSPLRNNFPLTFYDRKRRKFLKENQFSRFVPEQKIPLMGVGCQYDPIQPYPFNNLLYHLPVNLRTPSISGTEMNTGDWGSIAIYWDKLNHFRAHYQQT